MAVWKHIPDAYGLLFCPEGRFAQMRNITALPTVSTLTKWLDEAGLKKVSHVGTSVTTLEEQRATDWMTSYSLSNYLDPEDFSKTVEGHPSPQRSVFVANL